MISSEVPVDQKTRSERCCFEAMHLMLQTHCPAGGDVDEPLKNAKAEAGSQAEKGTTGAAVAPKKAAAAKKKVLGVKGGRVTKKATKAAPRRKSKAPSKKGG